MKNKSGNVRTTLASGVILILLAVTVFAFLLLYPGSRGGDSVDLIIPRGSSLAKVADFLAHEKVIEQPVLFKNLLRITQGSSRVRAGEFRFWRGMRPLDALLVLYHDEPIYHRVVIPEGWTARQIAEILTAEKLVDPKRFVDCALGADAAKKHKVSAPNLEGYLFPDTYNFSRIDGEEKIVEIMVQNFLHKYETEFKAKAQALGFTMNQFVTLASIVEKETGASDERELVSSVFHNRLKKKMRLQSDPTTIYGIPNFNGNLTRNDLHRYSPYNTYVIPALPPGPISNPGELALKATLNPAKTTHLYFVAKGEGHHIFADTYVEHNRNVTIYQLHRRVPAKE